MNQKENIALDKIPNHIAIIMDGNGRWAKNQGQERIYGHHNGVQAVRDTVEAAAELGVKYLTLYAFSTENWSRPQAEVLGLMHLLVETIGAELPTLQKNNIRLQTIGDTDALPQATREELQKAIGQTANNTGTVLILALSYSGRWELVQAVKRIAQAIENKNISIDDINIDTISQHLSTTNIPDPELLIRTSGEHRISNFLLWQIAYSELYFTNTFWPDFKKEDFYQAIIDFQQRERRFGLTGEQVQ